MKYDLSICIPALREEWLARTVADIVEKKRGKTEVIVVLDGELADPGVADHPDVRVIYSAKNLGQRGATNLGVRMSTAKWVAKCDAHTAYDEGFDVKLMAAVEGHDDWTIVPVMRNLHVFNWRCGDCGDETYQGAVPEGCKNCDVNTPDRFKKRLVWYPKPSPNSSAYKFTPTRLQFKYFGALKKRQQNSGESVVETMSLQGSFFMLSRAKYWELNICDESWGGWGQQGTEVALKTWLSGGRVVCCLDTWYAHQFRTQSGFAFPWNTKQGVSQGRQQQQARKMSADLFFTDRWDLQVRPLYWLVERFWDVLQEEPNTDDDPKWTREDLVRLKETSSKFRTWVAPSPAGYGMFGAKFVTPDTQFFSGVDSRGSGTSHDVISREHEGKMKGVTAAPIATDDVVKNRDVFPLASGDRADQPSINETVGVDSFVPVASVSISPTIQRPNPEPASSSSVDVNLGKNLVNAPGTQFINGKHVSIIPRAGILYFTDNELTLKIAKPVQRRIKQISEEMGMELVSSSRKPMSDMGQNVVTREPRGYLTMFKQILKGLEAMESDIVFMAEHDVLYPKEHFDFTPQDKNTFYYDINWWKIHDDGFTIHWDADQVSGLCAYRETLIKHYKERIETFDDADFDRKFEPGSGFTSEQWKASVPHIDIRHSRNLTYNKRGLDDFRKKETAVNLETSDTDSIPGWSRKELEF